MKQQPTRTQFLVSALALAMSCSDSGTTGTVIGNGVVRHNIAVPAVDLADAQDLVLLDAPRQGGGGTSGALTASAAPLTATSCPEGSVYNLLSMLPDGTLEVAACAEVLAVHPTTEGVVVQMMVPYEVRFVYEDDEGNELDEPLVVEDRVETTVYVHDGQTHVIGYGGFDYNGKLDELSAGNPQALEMLEYLWNYGAQFPRFFDDGFCGESDAGHLIFQGRPPGAADAGDTVMLYSVNLDMEQEPYTVNLNMAEVVSNEVFGSPQVRQVSGDYLLWQTTGGDGSRQVYSILSKERYSVDFSEFGNIVALDNDRVLGYRQHGNGHGRVLDFSKSGSLIQCLGDASSGNSLGIFVERCRPNECWDKFYIGAMMAGTYEGERGIYHVEGHADDGCVATQMAEIHENILDQNIWNGKDYYVYRTTDGKVWAMEKQEHEEFEEIGPIPSSPINLAYFVVSGNTIYYAGETTDTAQAVYRAYDIESGTERTISGLEAADHIVSLRR